LAEADLNMGDHKDALESCDRAIDTAKDDASRAYAHDIKGRVLSLIAESPNQMMSAEKEFRWAAQLDAAIAVYHLHLAQAMIRLSKDEASRPELNACLGASPSPEIAAFARVLLADPRRGRESLAPDFKIKDINGEQLSLKQFAGKVLVVDFWATWCPACKESIGELKALTRKYPANKLVLLSVSVDEKDGSWREFIDKKRMDWLQCRDSDHQLGKAFAIKSLPTYLVVDGDGIIRTRITDLDPRKSIAYRLRATLEEMPQLK
jgi:peroxiredoxin